MADGPESSKTDGHARNPFKQVLDEILLSAAIIAGHAALAIWALAMGWVVHKALDFFSDPEHPFQLGGVTARFLIEGGELMLIGVVLFFGVLSAGVIFLFRILAHVRGTP